MSAASIGLLATLILIISYPPLLPTKISTIVVLTGMMLLAVTGVVLWRCRP
ncbi:MAG: hypothetical protein QNJ45_14005 [Ardenticatenaceae bacterium]|nr:hypothetical protein [Ardenticatenaceae bacterium]